MIVALALLAQVTWGSAAQTIDCFGVAPADAEQISMSVAQADQLFSQGVGIGLSCARLRLGSYGPTEGYFGAAGTIGDSATALQNARLAQARGASIFAALWSCPASMKSGGSTIGGQVSNATACANYYVSAIQNAQTLGLSITGLEYQNEPDVTVAYESTQDTAAQLVSFIDTAGPIVRTAFPSIKLIASSSSQWQQTWAGNAYVPAILADGTAPTYVDYIGVHTYGSPDVSSAPGSTGGRHIWMTEMSFLGGPQDATMANALTAAGWIVDGLGTGQVSAWIWWQFQNFAGDTTNQGLYLNDGTVTKRLYMLGNFSKFIRPGMVVFGTTGTPPAGVSVIAAKDPTSNNVAVVAINTNGTGTAFTVTLDSTSKCQVATPWLTDSTHNLTAGTPIVIPASKVISATLAASSVTTFSCVGT